MQKSAYSFHTSYASTRRGLQGAGVGSLSGRYASGTSHVPFHEEGQTWNVAHGSVQKSYATHRLYAISDAPVAICDIQISKFSADGWSQHLSFKTVNRPYSQPTASREDMIRLHGNARYVGHSRGHLARLLLYLNRAEVQPIIRLGVAGEPHGIIAMSARPKAETSIR